MNNLKNSVNLIGRLGIDPEVRETQNDKKLARFSLATSEIYRDSEGKKKEDTQWHRVVAWGKRAETVEKLLEKGRKIAVEGKLINRQYETKDGEQRNSTEIILRDFLLLDQRKN